ncbi:MAG: beta-galactosidase [Anaerolineae bacterium]
MPTLTCHHNLFWLDDRPLLLQAGEFHYYRTPPEAWEQRLNLLKTAGFNAVASYIPWRWHEVREGEFDFDGHSHPQRDLSGFLDLASRLDLWIIARPGPYIMAETINEGIPDWVFDHYPQVTLLDQHGGRQKMVSYLHPDFLACAGRWYRAVFAVLAPRQITRGGRIVLVQLDNEMGMLHWLRNVFDLNPDTLARFAAWLRQTYAASLATRYPFPDLPAALRQHLLQPDLPHAAQVVADYRRFYRAYLREYAAWLLAEAQADGLAVPPVINIHGFANGGKTFPIGLSQLVDVLRLPDVIAATDVYPGEIGAGTFHQLLLVNAMTCAVQKPGQPLFSIEFQAGGNLDFSNMAASFYDLHTRLSLACGMRGINHYLFFDGENDPLLSPVKRHDWGHPVRKDGTLRSHYHRYPRLTRVLAAYGDALALARPEYVTTIGFRLDDFMTEVNLSATQEATAVITHQREAILFDFIARGLALTHRPFDAVELQQAELDPQRHPLLWAMLDLTCDTGTEQKLVAYVRAGGTLVLVGRLDPAGPLATALGLRNVTTDPPFTGRHVVAFGREIPASFVQTWTGPQATVFATCEGAAVGLLQPLAAGRVVLLSAAFPIINLDDLAVFEGLAQLVACTPPFALSAWADVRLSRGPAGDFLFINHYGDDPLETAITYRGAPLFGGWPIGLPARSGAILPLAWRVRPGVTLHYATAEVTSVREEGADLELTFAQPTFHAELTAPGYACPDAEAVDGARCRVHATNGLLRLRPLRA